MRMSRLNTLIYCRSYSASQFLRRHRTAIIVVGFVFWSAIFVVNVAVGKIGKVDNGFLILGFLWMTILPSIATYMIPRLLLQVMPLMNGYNPDENK